MSSLCPKCSSDMVHALSTYETDRVVAYWCSECHHSWPRDFGPRREWLDKLAADMVAACDGKDIYAGADDA